MHTREGSDSITPIQTHRRIGFRDRPYIDALPLASGKILTVQQPQGANCVIFKICEFRLNHSPQCLTTLTYQGKPTDRQLFNYYLPEGPILASKDRIISFGPVDEFLCRAATRLKEFFEKYATLQSDYNNPLLQFKPQCHYIGNGKFILLDNPLHSTPLTISVYQQTESIIEFVRTQQFNTEEQTLIGNKTEFFGYGHNFGLLSKVNNTLYFLEEKNNEFNITKTIKLMDSDNDKQINNIISYTQNEIIISGVNGMASAFSFTDNYAWIGKINLAREEISFLKIDYSIKNCSTPDLSLSPKLPLIVFKNIPREINMGLSYSLLDYENMAMVKLELPACLRVRPMPNGSLVLIQPAYNFAGFDIFHYPLFTRFIEERDNIIFHEISKHLEFVTPIAAIACDYVNQVSFTKNIFSFFKGEDIKEGKETKSWKRSFCSIL